MEKNSLNNDLSTEFTAKEGNNNNFATKIKKIFADNDKRNIIAFVLLILFSILILSRVVTSPKLYNHTIEVLNEKEKKVSNITAGAAAAATAISLIPGDASTPIANNILQISSYLLIVNCTIFLEKALIGVLGKFAAYVLIPIFCVMAIIYIVTKNKAFLANGLKILIFAVICITIVPLSVKISDTICESNSEIIEAVTLDEDNEVSDENSEEVGKFQALINKIKEAGNNVAEKGQELITKIFNAVALFIVSNCVVPIGTAFIIAWLCNMIFGAKIPLKLPNHKVSLFSKIKGFSKNKK